MNSSDYSLLSLEVEIEKDSNGVLGFSSSGGSNGSFFGSRFPGVFIHHVIADSPAGLPGKLQIGDRIIAVDNNDIRDVEHKFADDLITEHAKNQKSVKLKIERCPRVHEVVIKKGSAYYDEELGVTVTARHDSSIDQEHGDRRIFIREVEDGSAAETAELKAGQLLIAINGETIFDATNSQLEVLLNWGLGLRLLVAEPDSFFSQPLSSTNGASQAKSVDYLFFNGEDQFEFTVTVGKNMRSIIIFILTWFFTPILILSVVVSCITYICYLWESSGTETIAEPAKILEHIIHDEFIPN